MHRFFVSPSLITVEKSFRLEGEIAHQLGRVLRLGPGAQILLLDGTGKEYVAELGQFQMQKNSTSVEGRILEERIAGNEPKTHVTLFQSLLKGEKFDYVLQKATEIGVSAFVPVLSERVIGGGSPNKLERWRKIVREAAEQSRRGLLPIVAEPIIFEQALKQATNEGLGLLAWEDEKTLSLKKALQGSNQVQRVNLLIGPEGGYSSAEAEQARQAGVISVSLGPRILRAETAGPTATALILYELGDM